MFYFSNSPIQMQKNCSMLQVHHKRQCVHHMDLVRVFPSCSTTPVQQWQCALPVSLSVPPEAGVAGLLSWHSGWHRTHTETGMGKGAKGQCRR